MSGQTIINTFLKENDPSLFLKDMFKIYDDYNNDNWRWFDTARRWWIEKVTYPLFRRRVYKAQLATADLLYYHPEKLVFVVTRYLVYLLSYAKCINELSAEEIIEAIFPPGMIFMDMKTTEIQEGQQLNSYSLGIKSLIIQDSEDYLKDKYAHTLLEVDVDKKEYKISQIVYDTWDPSKFKTAKIIYSKEFYLDSTGNLTNPNYVLDKTLLQEDMLYYRLMISQLMIFLGEIFDETTKLFFIGPKEK